MSDRRRNTDSPGCSSRDQGKRSLSCKQTPSHQTDATAQQAEQCCSCVPWKRKGRKVREGIYFSARLKHLQDSRQVISVEIHCVAQSILA